MLATNKMLRLLPIHRAIHWFEWPRTRLLWLWTKMSACNDWSFCMPVFPRNWSSTHSWINVFKLWLGARCWMLAMTALGVALVKGGRLVFPLSNHSWMNFRVCHSVSGDGALHEFGTVGKVVGCFHLWIPRYPTVTVTGRLFGFLVIPGKILSVLCLCCWQAGTIPVPHHRELVTLQLQFSWEIPDHLHSKLNSIYWGL